MSSEMKTVTFVKNHGRYFGGDCPDSAQFEKGFADELIAAGIAKEYEGGPAAEPDTEKKANTKKF